MWLSNGGGFINPMSTFNSVIDYGPQLVDRFLKQVTDMIFTHYSRCLEIYWVFQKCYGNFRNPLVFIIQVIQHYFSICGDYNKTILRIPSNQPIPSVPPQGIEGPRASSSLRCDARVGALNTRNMISGSIGCAWFLKTSNIWINVDVGISSLFFDFCWPLKFEGLWHKMAFCFSPSLVTECLLFFVDDFDIATEFQFTLVGFWGFQVVHIYGNICQETGRGNGLQGINHGSLLCLILKLSVNFQPYFARPKSLWRAIFIQNWELTSQFWDLCLLDMNRYRDCSKI